MNSPPQSDSLEDAAERAPGRIITFYSYKGGTGRSMALANVAWILASNGARVMVLDWDLEAPGLHRYFRPFLPDNEMTESPGLIDCFVHFAEAARMEASNSSKQDSPERSWFYDRADLLRYSVALDYDFPDGGVIDFVSAGQQGPSYGARVNSFQWADFYEKLGGGVFLEAMKQQLRQRYDYVLIDSRTGLSDTSGICTVQMPDELVVCFTLNRQSIFGAAATASSADNHRRLPTGEQGLRIWPVPTRVELHEKDRLETARLVCRERFAPFLWHIPVAGRPAYWGSVEVLYFPYYAYEEVLATIADTPQSTASLLNSMERLTGYLTKNTQTPISAMPTLDSRSRAQLLARYHSTVPDATVGQKRQPRIYVSYAKADDSLSLVRKLAAEIVARFGPNSVFWDEKVPLGKKWKETLVRELQQADTLVIAVGPNWHASSESQEELQLALKLDKPVIPLLIGGVRLDMLPQVLSERHGLELREATLDEDIRSFVRKMPGDISEQAGDEPSVPIQIDDPQKGQWGGQSERDGRRLSARVTEGSMGREDWFQVILVVQSTGGEPLQGVVEFHLHPSFNPSLLSVPVEDDRALLKHRAWGAFTVGASADEGRTRLELDLAELSDAPEVFRKR